jgi:cobalamin biosynthesis protein CobT
MFLGFGKKSAAQTGENQPYRAYTTEFDEVVSAAHLSLRYTLSLDLLTSLRDLTPARIGATRRAMEFQARFNAGHTLGERPVFTVLIDHSGSMRGPKSLSAAILADIAATIFEDMRTPLDLLGFTTSTWQGGKSRKKWLSRRSPTSPGRLCDLLHIVYLDATKPDRSWGRFLPLMMLDDVLKENIDGEALLWARQRVLPLNPTAWVCVVVSDGVPMDDATVMANGGERTGWYLQQHLNAVVEGFNGDPAIRLGCLALDTYASNTPFSALRHAKSLNDAPAMFYDLLDDLIWPKDAD